MSPCSDTPDRSVVAEVFSGDNIGMKINGWMSESPGLEPEIVIVRAMAS